MKLRKLYYVIFFCIVLLLASFFIWIELQERNTPFKYCNTSGWHVSNCLKRIWPALKKENINQIIFCKRFVINERDKCECNTPVSQWPVSFEVPQGCLNGAIELLDKAVNQSNILYSTNIWGEGVSGWQIRKVADTWFGLQVERTFAGTIVEAMKIVTDKGKYIFPFTGWNAKNVCIIGTDWSSNELYEYLTQCKLNLGQIAESNEVSLSYRQQYWDWLSKYNTPFSHNALIRDLKGKNIEAIIITKGFGESPVDSDFKGTSPICIIGDPNIVAEILGKNIEYDIVFKNPVIVLETTKAFIKAEDDDGELVGINAPRFIFLARDKAYVVRYNWKFKENFVVGFDFNSKKLDKSERNLLNDILRIVSKYSFPVTSSFLQDYYKEKKVEAN